MPFAEACASLRHSARLASSAAAAARLFCSAVARADSHGQGPPSAETLRQSAPLGPLGRERGGSGSIVLLGGGARGFHRQRGGGGGGGGRQLDLVRFSPIPLEGEHVCALVSRRSKQLKSRRRVPLGDCSAGPLIVRSIYGTGIKPESLESLFQLANIIPGDTGDEIPVCRGPALENEHRAP